MRTWRAPFVICGYFCAMFAFTLFLLHENVQGQLTLLLPSRSEQVFVTLSLVQLLVAAFLAPAFAAGAISGERERRTLVVLLSTPLSALGILIGKILSSSALLALLLAVSLPLYSLVFLFGGAVPGEVVAVFAFQLFTLVLIAAISVCWSTLALRSGWSTVVSYATVAVMVVLTGVLGYGLQLVAAHDPVEYFLVIWGKCLLELNPLWVEAALAGAVPASPHAWLWFALAYSSVCCILAVPSVLRLRPQALSFLPWRPRAEERDYH